MANIAATNSFISGGSVRFSVRFTAVEVGKTLTVQIVTDQGVLPVRGWREAPAPAAEAFIVVHEIPLNILFTIEVLLDGAVVASLTYRGIENKPNVIPATHPLLTDPITGASAPVIIQSWPERAHSRKGHLLEVSGASFPVVIDGRETAATSTVTVIHAADPGSARALENLLESTSTLQVRPSCPHMPAAWLSVRDRRRRTFSARPDSALVDVMDVAHVGQPLPDVPAISSTLLDLSTRFDKLNKLTYMPTLGYLSQKDWAREVS